MIAIIDQFRIDAQGQKLYLNAHVNEAEYFENMYIEKVTICTEDQVSESNPLAPGTQYVYQHTYSNEEREIGLVLSATDFNLNFTKSDLSHNMFFVYIKCGGTPASDTPCGMDEATTVGVTFDYGGIYNTAMNYTRELADDCTIPRGFIDYILNTQALQLSLDTGHYIPAINYWRWLMGIGNRKGISYRIKACGCHG